MVQVPLRMVSAGRQLNRDPLGSAAEANIRAYRFTFYKLYSWNLQRWGMEDVPQWNACLGLSFNILANCLSLLIAIDLVGIPAAIPVGRAAGLALFGAALAAHYFYFIRSGRYLQLPAEFSGGAARSRVMSISAWSYIIGSPILLLALAFTGAMQRAA